MKTHLLLRVGLLLLLPMVQGCGKKGIAGEIQAFKDAGRSVSEFADTDASSMQAKRCQQGTIDQMSVLLCEYDLAGAPAGQDCLRGGGSRRGRSERQDGGGADQGLPSSREEVARAPRSLLR